MKLSVQLLLLSLASIGSCTLLELSQTLWTRLLDGGLSKVGKLDPLRVPVVKVDQSEGNTSYRVVLRNLEITGLNDSTLESVSLERGRLKSNISEMEAGYVSYSDLRNLESIRYRFHMLVKDPMVMNDSVAESSDRNARIVELNAYRLIAMNEQDDLVNSTTSNGQLKYRDMMQLMGAHNPVSATDSRQRNPLAVHVVYSHSVKDNEKDKEKESSQEQPVTVRGCQSACRRPTTSSLNENAKYQAETIKTENGASGLSSSRLSQQRQQNNKGYDTAASDAYTLKSTNEGYVEQQGSYSFPSQSSSQEYSQRQTYGGENYDNDNSGVKRPAGYGGYGGYQPGVKQPGNYGNQFPGVQQPGGHSGYENPGVKQPGNYGHQFPGAQQPGGHGGYENTGVKQPGSYSHQTPHYPNSGHQTPTPHYPGHQTPTPHYPGHQTPTPQYPGVKQPGNYGGNFGGYENPGVKQPGSFGGHQSPSTSYPGNYEYQTPTPHYPGVKQPGGYEGGHDMSGVKQPGGYGGGGYQTPTPYYPGVKQPGGYGHSTPRPHYPSSQPTPGVKQPGGYGGGGGYVDQTSYGGRLMEKPGFRSPMVRLEKQNGFVDVRYANNGCKNGQEHFAKLQIQPSQDPRVYGLQSTVKDMNETPRYAKHNFTKKDNLTLRNDNAKLASESKKIKDLIRYAQKFQENNGYFEEGMQLVYHFGDMTNDTSASNDTRRIKRQHDKEEDDVMHVTVKIRVPMLRVKADYNLMGNVGEQPLRGNGLLTGNFTNLIADFMVELKKVDEKSMIVRATRAKLTSSDRKIKLEGMDDKGPVEAVLAQGLMAAEAVAAMIADDLATKALSEQTGVNGMIYQMYKNLPVQKA